MNAKVIHPAFRTYDIDKTVAFYNKYFGFRLDASADLGDLTLNFLKDSGNQVELEFTVFKNPNMTTGMGNGGFDHLAISVDDLPTLHKMMTEDGLEPTELMEVKLGNVVLAKVFYVNDPNGYKLEMVQREGRWA
ncbi:VOC family protein [Flavobacterium oreochromis]|uniref:Aldoketomutase n=1 Tax=Flavobacterium columnare TaxID=996 RepID=A0A246G866_9FLAO|nr:VOC family protein [Flavobacterium oreochromis]OWP74950.1 hypothetical protein BWK62_13160 [Flavobacterium oreochromis]POR24036.1 hypothetical protein BWK58_08860 [Flavobacterium columnare]